MNRETLLKRLKETNFNDYVLIVSKFGEVETYFIYSTLEETQKAYRDITRPHVYNMNCKLEIVGLF